MKRKKDIYRRRQLTALAMLILIFVLLIALMVKCSAGLSDKKPEVIPEISDGSYDMPNMEIPENSVILKNERPVMHEYTELSDLNFLETDFAPEDISLVNEKYLNDVVIVGDSISKGYSVYGRLNENSVLAVGSIGIRNVLDTAFPYQGYELELTDILSRKKPKYIFISLGMNDIHMKTEEQFAEDYKNVIAEIKKVTPDSVIIVTAITPVSRQTDFTKNEIIDSYNETLRRMVFDYNSNDIFYANAARYLKDDSNYLITEFSSGDGIHLAASAYDYLLTYMLSMLEWI